MSLLLCYTKMFQTNLAKGFDRVDIVFDRYFGNSLKKQTRMERGLGGSRVLNMDDEESFPKNFQDITSSSVWFISPSTMCNIQAVAVLGGGGWAMALGLALFMPNKGLALLLPPPPPPPQCICQNVQKYSVRCLKVVPGVPKMVLIRSKSKKYPPISSKAACKICPKVTPDGPKMA